MLKSDLLIYSGHKNSQTAYQRPAGFISGLKPNEMIRQNKDSEDLNAKQHEKHTSHLKQCSYD